MIQASITVKIEELLPLIEENLKRLRDSWPSTPYHRYPSQTDKIHALMQLRETTTTLRDNKHAVIEIDSHVYVDMIRAKEYNEAVEKNG